MNPVTDPRLLEESKRREYLKQQQQLRNMSKPKNNLSADAMIENLLSKKEIFQKKVPSSNSQQQNLMVPPLYVAVWEWCRVSAPASVELADTNKISALLMTSRLPVDTLGYIWSLANQTVPGSLTQIEVYTTLALVALAQSGYSFKSSAVVNQLGKFPLPILDLSLMSVAAASGTTAEPSTEQAEGDDDEFDEFKSADLSSLNVDNLRVLEVSSATSSSLIRFDSPKRLPVPLSLIDSPSKNSPTRLSVLDLPLTETSHQPPFDRQTTPPAERPSDQQAQPTEPAIHSISAGVSSDPNSPAHIEDLFPKCVVRRSVDLLDWEAPSAEDFLTCDLSTNIIEMNSNEPNSLPSTDNLININDGIEQLKIESVPQDVSLPEKTSEPTPLDNKNNSIEFLEKIESSPTSVESSELNLSKAELPIKPASPTMSKSAEPSLEKGQDFLDMDDKYSALRVLESKPSDDFGDFLAADPVCIEQPPPLPQPTIQEQCIDAGFKLLRQAISSFETITDEKILIEILDDPRCKKYLEELGEVYNVSERLTRGSSARREELEGIWRTLGRLTREALPPSRKVMDDEIGVRCGVCLQESGSKTQVRYAMNYFHSSCANLYLHCVGGASLPLNPLQ